MSNPADKTIIATCIWCKSDLVDGREESGFTGEGPDYMTPDGDFGCDPSPDSTADGVGSHAPNSFTTWDGHLIEVTDCKVVKHNHEW